MAKLNFGTIRRCSVDLDTATLLGLKAAYSCPRKPARFSGLTRPSDVRAAVAPDSCMWTTGTQNNQERCASHRATLI